MLVAEPLKMRSSHKPSLKCNLNVQSSFMWIRQIRLMPKTIVLLIHTRTATPPEGRPGSDVVLQLLCDCDEPSVTRLHLLALVDLRAGAHVGLGLHAAYVVHE